MTNEKKLWLCEQYAQKAWALSLALAQEAARAGLYGKGYAVVASETRIMANKLLEYAAEARFGVDNEDTFKGILFYATETGFLAVNTMLEILHVESADEIGVNNKSIAVCAEEVRNLALALNDLADKPVSVWQKPFVLPEIISPIESSRKIDFFFRFSIGGVPLVENALNVVEVCYPRKVDTKGEIFPLRGMEIPMLDCFRRFNLSCASLDPDRRTVIIINPDYGGYYGHRDGECAVLVDDLDVNTIFQSRIAHSVPPKASGVFADCARECWDVVGGDQLVFVDWQKLIHK
jgi:hypothetical protein